MLVLRGVQRLRMLRLKIVKTTAREEKEQLVLSNLVTVRFVAVNNLQRVLATPLTLPRLIVFPPDDVSLSKSIFESSSNVGKYPKTPTCTADFA